MRWGVLVLVLLFVSCASWTVLEQEPAPSPASIGQEEEAGPPPAPEKKAPQPGRQDKEPRRLRLPGPEHKKLHYFEGKWKGEVSLVGDLWRTKADTTSEITYEKICGGFFLSYDYVQHRTKEYPITYFGRGTMTFDAEARKYRMWWFDSRGQMQDGHGIWDGETLRFEFDLTWGGRKTRQATTYTFVSDTEYHLKMENAFEDQSLRTVFTAKYTKQP